MSKKLTRAANVRTISCLIAVALCLVALTTHAQRRKTPPPRRAAVPRKTPAPRATPAAPIKTPATAQTIIVRTEPNAIVWLDEVRRGTTDAAGQLEIKKVSAGRRVLRVRAPGFAERVMPLLPTQRGVIALKLTRTTDEAELTFQRAEAAREKATDDEARKAAVELYRRALALRPRYASAHVGLARTLLELSDYDGALAEVDAARAVRAAYAEASAVEGRVLHSQGDDEAAIAAYQRALGEARGFQPEAYTGMGIALEEKGRYEQAAAAYTKAVAQLADTEPVLYELLGRTYERLEKYKEAVAAYEKYLQLAPDGKLAPAIRSVIDQLRQQAAGQDIPLPPPGE